MLFYPSVWFLSPHHNTTYHHHHHVVVHILSRFSLKYTFLIGCFLFEEEPSSSLIAVFYSLFYIINCKYGDDALVAIRTCFIFIASAPMVLKSHLDPIYMNKETSWILTFRLSLNDVNKTIPHFCYLLTCSKLYLDFFFLIVINEFRETGKYDRVIHKVTLCLKGILKVLGWVCVKVKTLWLTWGTWRRVVSIHRVAQTQDSVKTQKSSLNEHPVLQEKGLKSRFHRGHQNWDLMHIPSKVTIWNPPFRHFKDTLNIICKNQMDLLLHDKSQSQLQ